MSGIPITPARTSHAFPLHPEPCGKAFPLRGANPGAAKPLRDGGVRSAPEADAHASDRLRKVSHQLEGVFLNQLFQAMRESVPASAPGSGGEGERLFDGMFDEAMAGRAAARSERGIGDAIYRQLERRLPHPGGANASASTTLGKE